MKIELLCGIIKRKSDGKEEFFPIKVNSITKQRIEDDLGARSLLAKEFMLQACKQLGVDPEDHQVSILKPEGDNYKIFLNSLSPFSMLELEDMTIDLSAFQYRSDA